MGYRDPERTRQAQLAYYHRYRKTWLAKQTCRRCGRRGPPLRVLRKAGTPKLSWGPDGPRERVVAAVTRAAERKAPQRRHRIELTADEKRMVAENGRCMADVPPCPVHGRTRAIRIERGPLAYRCCGRAVAV